MSTQERRPDTRGAAPTPPASTPEQPSGADASGDAFLAAADVAIARALSGRPEAFLAQNRQLGGQ